MKIEDIKTERYIYIDGIKIPIAIKFIESNNTYKIDGINFVDLSIHVTACINDDTLIELNRHTH